eukprot:5675622-Pleurochrysis_carterae.AAC.2
MLRDLVVGQVPAPLRLRARDDPRSDASDEGDRLALAWILEEALVRSPCACDQRTLAHPRVRRLTLTPEHSDSHSNSNAPLYTRALHTHLQDLLHEVGSEPVAEEVVDRVKLAAHRFEPDHDSHDGEGDERDSVHARTHKRHLPEPQEGLPRAHALWPALPRRCRVADVVEVVERNWKQLEHGEEELHADQAEVRELREADVAAVRRPAEPHLSHDALAEPVRDEIEVVDLDGQANHRDWGLPTGAEHGKTAGHRLQQRARDVVVWQVLEYPQRVSTEPFLRLGQLCAELRDRAHHGAAHALPEQSDTKWGAAALPEPVRKLERTARKSPEDEVLVVHALLPRRVEVESGDKCAEERHVRAQPRRDDWRSGGL